MEPECGFVVFVLGDGLDRVVRCVRPGDRWHTVEGSCVPYRTIRIPEGSLLHALLSHRTCDAPWLTEVWQGAGTSPDPEREQEQEPTCQSPDDGYGEETVDEADEPPEDDEWSVTTESGSDGEPGDNIPLARDHDNLFDRGRYAELVALQDIPPNVHLDAERLAIMHNLAALALVHDARRRAQRVVDEPRHTALDTLLYHAIPRCVALWRWLQRCCCCVPCQRRDE